MNLKIIILAAMLAAFGLPLQGQSKNRTSPSDAPPSTVAKEHRAEVSIPDTRRFTVVSKLSGRAYQIDVALPQAPQPNGGYPVIYVLDGNWYFASVVEAVRREKPETVVVGVGYPLGSRTWTRNALSKYQSLPASIDSSAWAVNFARLYDLTPPQDDESLKNENLFCVNNQICTHDSVGGVDDFLKI